MSKRIFLTIALIIYSKDVYCTNSELIEHLKSCSPYEDNQIVESSTIQYEIYGRENNACKYSETDDSNKMICYHSQQGVENTIDYLLQQNPDLGDMVNIRARECKFYNISENLSDDDERGEVFRKKKLETIFFQQNRVTQLRNSAIQYVNLHPVKIPVTSPARNTDYAISAVRPPGGMEKKTPQTVETPTAASTENTDYDITAAIPLEDMGKKMLRTTKRAEKEQKAVAKQATKDQRFSLDSIIFISTERWKIWVNKKPFINNLQFQVLDIDVDSVTFVYNQNGKKIIFKLSPGETFLY